MKKLLLIASLLLVPSMGFGYTNADDAFNQADAASKAGGKDGWARVGEIKREADVILTELKQLLADNKAALTDPTTPAGLKGPLAAGLGTATGNINAWQTAKDKIDAIITAHKQEFIIGSAQKAVELKNAVKAGAASDTSVSGNAVWGQL